MEYISVEEAAQNGVFPLEAFNYIAKRFKSSAIHGL